MGDRRDRIRSGAYHMARGDAVSAQPSEKFSGGYAITNDDLDLKLDALTARVNAVETTLTSILDRLDTIVDNIKPIIEQLENSPIVKMLTGGKKR
jgi:hypothetical protein